MSEIQKIVYAASSAGVVGALLATMGSKDTFKNTTKKATSTKHSSSNNNKKSDNNSDSDNDNNNDNDVVPTINTNSTFLKFGIIGILIIVVVLFLTIFFLFAIYKMVPNHKVLHTIMSLLLSSLWYIPMLFYYCVIKDYKLTSLSIPAAANNRARNTVSRYH